MSTVFPQPFTLDVIVRTAGGVVLLVAAGLQGYAVATEPMLETSLLESRWLLLGVVEFEILLALFLLAGVCAKPSWAAALVCFGLLACLSLDRALAGCTTCACFGRRVSVNPWDATILSLAIVFSLLRWRPKGQQPSSPVRLRKVSVRMIPVLGMWFAVAVPAALVLMMCRPAPVALLDSDTPLPDDSKLALLESENATHAVLSQSSAAPQRPDCGRAAYRAHSESACGPLALIAALDSMGVKVTANERHKILQASGDVGTSMLQLRQLAEEQGLHALGVEIPLVTMRQLNLHAIVLVNDVAFAAVTGYTGYGVQLVYPLKSPAVVPDASFERVFGRPGKALLLSTEPLLPSQLGIGPAKPSVLRLSRNVLTVGRVYRPDWEGRIELHNDGDRTIHLGNIAPSCSCVTAALDRHELQRGECAILDAKGEQAEIGPFRHDIVITTDVEDAPVLRIPIRGIYSLPVFFERQAVLMPDLLEGQTGEIDVPLFVAERRSLDGIAFVIPAGAPIEAKAVRAASGQPVARIRWGGSVPPGLYRYDVRVATDETAPLAQQPLDLTIRVLRAVDPRPPSFYIRDSEVFSKWGRRADIHLNARASRSADAHTAAEWSFSWSDQRFPEGILVDVLSSDTNRVSLRLSSRGTEHARALAGHRATLEVRTRGGGRAHISVHIGRTSFLASAADPMILLESKGRSAWFALTSKMALAWMRRCVFLCLPSIQ